MEPITVLGESLAGGRLLSFSISVRKRDVGTADDGTGEVHTVDGPDLPCA
jgi:hypothetical protein